jgi:hypothetical protein
VKLADATASIKLDALTIGLPTPWSDPRHC